MHGSEISVQTTQKIGYQCLVLAKFGGHGRIYFAGNRFDSTKNRNLYGDDLIPILFYINAAFEREVNIIALGS